VPLGRVATPGAGLAQDALLLSAPGQESPASWDQPGGASAYRGRHHGWGRPAGTGLAPARRGGRACSRYTTGRGPASVSLPYRIW